MGGNPPQLQTGFTEPPEPKKQTVQEPVAAGERRPVGTGQSGVVVTEAPEPPETKKGVGTPFTAKGTLVPGLTPDEQQLKTESDIRIFRAERAQRAAEMRAMGVSTQALSDYANVGEISAEEAQRLHIEHFDVAKQRLNSLYEQVDQARSLKVNPFNWHESVGRGGRVAAAFAVMTGQMAAGAGNPNSALKMMDAAINRDIAAQQQNIKNQYEALRQQRGLGQDERQLYAEEIASLNEVKAMTYGAINGRIAAAMQHAQNEAAYQSYNVMQDHYNVKLLESIAAARAEILRVEVNEPIRASKLRALQAQIEQVQTQLKPGALLGAEAPAAEEVSAPPAPGRAGAVAGRRGRPDTAARRVPVAPSPETGAPSPEQLQTLPRGVEDEALAMSIPAEPEAAPPAPAPEEVAPAKRDTRSAIAAEIPGDAKRRNFILQEGGYGRAAAANAGFPTSTITRIDDAFDAYSKGDPIPGDGFNRSEDAIIFAKLIKGRPPRRNKFRTEEGWEEAKRQHEFQTRHWEIFEQESVQNTIDTGGGRVFRVKGVSPARRTDANGTNRYYEIVDKMVEGQEYVNKLVRVAKNYRRVGPGSGFFNENEGAFSIPGLTTTDPGTKELAQDVTRLAMGFIKSEDPTARLSDKDLEVGEAAMGLMASGKIKLLDIFQSLDGKYDTNTIRLSMERYLQGIAVEAQKAYYRKFANDLVPDYNTATALAEEADKTQLWLNQNP